jgi:hypothetical protein
MVNSGGATGKTPAMTRAIFPRPLAEGGSRTSSPDAFERDGLTVFEQVLTADEGQFLSLACDEIVDDSLARGRREWGVRNLLFWSSIGALARCDKIRALVTPVLGPGARATRGILFDKSEGANWGVLWHQDLSLAVADRVDIPGWGQWTLKQGVHHAQPSEEVLEKMVTLRIHIDDCDADNGPLCILPGSHAMGRLSAPAIRALRHATSPTICAAAAGDVLMMRPLLVHSSAASERPARRRVIHLEYVDPAVLPAGVRLCDA